MTQHPSRVSRTMLHEGSSEATTLSPGYSAEPIAKIRWRRADSTRNLKPEAVVELAESINIVGQLEPIIVDTEGHLIAGGHRLAAMQLLAVPNSTERRASFLNRCGWTPADANDAPPEPLNQLSERVAHLGDNPLSDPSIRVHVLQRQEENADKWDLAIETAENSVRRQYTPEEVRALAERFHVAGYRSEVGKPKPGEKSLLAALSTAVGTSRRTIQRIIAGEPEKTDRRSKWDKAVEGLLRACKRVQKAGSHRRTPAARAILDATETIINTIKPNENRHLRHIATNGAI